MSDNRCFIDCTVPSNASYTNAFDKHSAFSSTQLPNASSCTRTNVSAQQTRGGINASQYNEAPSEIIVPEYFDQGILSVLNDSVSFGECETFGPSEGRFSLLPLKDEAKTLTHVHNGSDDREREHDLSPSSSSFWHSYPLRISENVGWTETLPLPARAISSQTSHCAETRSVCALEGAITYSPYLFVCSFFDHWWATNGVNSLERPMQKQHLCDTGHSITPSLPPVQLLKLRGHQPELQSQSANSNSDLVNSAAGAAQRDTYVEVPGKVTTVAKSKTTGTLPSDEARTKREAARGTSLDANWSHMREPPRNELEGRRLLQKSLDSESYFALRREAHRASLASVRHQLKEHFTQPKI
ncbi:hypothetical protein TraAM80_08763 [Trypanosoma rangeli]|uniref:Uncharacterized protein n=1 Tax=Trypanosoma rangeli TaxID=5698 RepID=A0A3R7N8F4_TRYRA|nr:uncharacterized protein TraAM80_08763 [Trypanosoma rangeli]RNE98442.1 hypothetical protein TraAM80_08763 [Trypanosoma rangeli]|eukprot:RNE98442.1 hypothetical protein TraAM80_08763 [Trypanosoma rangeli]